MNEILTPVNDGQVSDESSQVESTEAVNADNVETTNDGQEQTQEGSKQEEAAQPDKPQEPSAQSKEENAQFAKVRKEAEARAKSEYEAKQTARDTEFSKRAAQFGWTDSDGNPIKTEEAYWKEVDTRSKVETLVSQGKDPEAALLQVENDRLKAERAEEANARAEQEKRQSESTAFFDFFKEVNGRDFNPSDIIPSEVFQIAEQNKIPLKYAYAEHLSRAAIAKEKSLTLGKQTAEANAKNAQTSPGSVSGTPQSDTVTEAEINAHANDTAWMMKNYDKVMSTMNKKKG